MRVYKYVTLCFEVYNIRTNLFLTLFDKIEIRSLRNFPVEFFLEFSKGQRVDRSEFRDKGKDESRYDLGLYKI